MTQNENLTCLTLNGYEPGIAFDETQFEQARIEEIRSVLRKWFRKMKNINLKRSSYSLKHAMERYLGRERVWEGAVDGYVSNGELIYAMVLEGFDVRREGINAFFNISEIDYDAFNIVGSMYESQWHIPHTHVTLDRIFEVEPDSKGNYSALRYHIVRRAGFDKYRNSISFLIK